MRYLITFSCYGTHIHGDSTGSVDRKHNLFGGPAVEPDVVRAGWVRERMDHPPYILEGPEIRAVILATLHEVCTHRNWSLLAAHVRTTHVHAVVESEVRPEIIMNAFKSYASRNLNRGGDADPKRKRWARHRSTRWLIDDDQARNAIRYVVDEQGTRMAVFYKGVL